jgi:Dolichyl-phosphate-mannose-protein mannosyltransferase
VSPRPLRASAWASPWGPLALALLAAFAAFALGFRRTDAITDDWQGWRQADTQAMARSQAEEGFDPISPRIDWRGDGPGYVEAEMPLYPMLVGLGLRAVGDSVLPGQLLSLLFIVLAALLLYRDIARRFGGQAGFFAVLAVVTGQGAIVLSTSIQPDSLSFLAFTIGCLSFVSYVEDRRTSQLFLWILATCVAGLVKPTTLELGLAQFLFCVFVGAARKRAGSTKRHPLRDLKMWLGWFLILSVVTVYLLHARQLYLTYGNTFGVLSGGDSKLPALERLGELMSWRELGRYAVVWGTTWPSLLATALVLLVGRGRFGPEIWALGLAALALNLLAFRYTSGPFGTHYHMPHAVLGAILVARAVAALRPLVHEASSIVSVAPSEASSVALRSRSLPRPVIHLLLVGFAALCAFSAFRAVRFLDAQPPQHETELGLALGKLAPPNTLVAVRARAGGRAPEWKTANNFEDPRVFYLSRTKGWVLPNDLAGQAATQRLDDLIQRGARYYVHVTQIEPDAELRAFLAARAERVFDSAAGQIYVLRTK